jgi:3-deoxy-D-manno-octulosonate 8-phosphate phosphatase (KDO 8-P phosphatase)
MEFGKDIREAKERAQNVKLFGHDIHGALTANMLFCDIEGNRRYGFWHMDGFGDLSLSANEIRIAYLDTTSIDGEGLFRAKELKLDKYYYAIEDKRAKLEEIRKEMNITDAGIGYLGSDFSDISIMKKVGFAVATADAIDEVKAAACYITNAPGGRGAMREICEFILSSMGKWEGWVEKVTKMGYK